PLVEQAAQRRAQLRGDDDGQRAVLEAVLVEDVAEAWTDEAPESGGHERPHRGLARRPTREVRRRHEDASVPVGRLVQDEFWPFRTVLPEAHVVEQVALVARSPRLA